MSRRLGATKPAPRWPSRRSAIQLRIHLEAKAYAGATTLGQLDDSSFVSKLIPTAVAGGTFVHCTLERRRRPTCGLERSGTVWCWGEDPAQPGIRLTFRNEPIAIPSDRPMRRSPSDEIAARSTRRRRVLLGRERARSAWRWRHAAARVPTRVSGDTRFTSISAGFWSTCGLTTDRTDPMLGRQHVRRARNRRAACPQRQSRCVETRRYDS